MTPYRACSSSSESSEGKPWELAPAYDLAQAYNPNGDWTNQHQMSVNGKRDDFTRSDLLAVASEYGIKNASDLTDAIVEAVRMWTDYAEAAGVSPEMAKSIGATHRLNLAVQPKGARGHRTRRRI